MGQTTRLSWWLAAAAAATAACGEVGDAPPGARIPMDAPTVRAASTGCLTLGAGERVLSASPEGDLWVHDAASGAISVIQPGGARRATPHVLPGLRRLQAWSDTRATALADDGLFALDEAGLHRASLPAPDEAPLDFCGDPTGAVDGFVLLGLDVYERAAGQWWRWSLEDGAGFGRPIGLGRVDGACRRVGGPLWLPTGDAVWRLAEEGALRLSYPARALRAGGPHPPAVGDDAGALAVGLGDTLRGVPSDPGPIAAFDTGGETLWVVTGGALHVLTPGEPWRRLLHDGAPSPVDEVWAHAAGGAWARAADTLCHHALGPLVRVRGLRPEERRVETSATIVVESDVAEAAVRLSLDGVDVATGALDAGRFTSAGLALGARGAHRLAVALEHAGGAARREVAVELHPSSGFTWSADVQPIFATHCASRACHGPDPSAPERPDLSTFEAWVALGDTIRERVGVLADMPPPEWRRDDWGPDEVETLVGWIDGGRERGE